MRGYCNLCFVKSFGQLAILICFCQQHVAWLIHFYLPEAWWIFTTLLQQFSSHVASPGTINNSTPSPHLIFWGTLKIVHLPLPFSTSTDTAVFLWPMHRMGHIHTEDSVSNFRSLLLLLQAQGPHFYG